jgi:hypothetical protein
LIKNIYKAVGNQNDLSIKIVSEICFNKEKFIVQNLEDFRKIYDSFFELLKIVSDFKNIFVLFNDFLFV